MARWTSMRPSARGQWRRRHIVVGALAAVAGLELWGRGGASRFAAAAPSQRVFLPTANAVELEVPVDVRATEEAEAAYEAARNKRKQEANATNMTLQLGDGFPGDIGTDPTKKGPQWATCFVDVKEAGRVSQDGVRPPKNVLEEWVLRGDQEQLASFRSWTASRNGPNGEASARCVPLSAKSTEDIFCLDCITHGTAGGLPFTPDGHVTHTASGSILTFGGLSECLSSTVGRGFCMKGSLALPSL